MLAQKKCGNKGKPWLMCYQQTLIVTNPDWVAVKDGLLLQQIHLLTAVQNCAVCVFLETAVIHDSCNYYALLCFYDSISCTRLWLEKKYYIHMQQCAGIAILSSFIKFFFFFFAVTQKSVSIYVPFTFGHSLHHKFHMEQFFWVVTFNLGHSFFKCHCHQSTLYWGKNCCRWIIYSLLFFFFFLRTYQRVHF